LKKKRRRLLKINWKLKEKKKYKVASPRLSYKKLKPDSSI